MHKHLFHVVPLFFLAATSAFAADGGNKDDGEVKEISGMSIVGNNETPTSLVIVPWKSSEIGQETKLKSNLLDDGLTPVDRAVFTRELDFYRLANPK
jgi:hypothetical protein